LKSRLQYISHGEKETGGYAHEKTLFETLANELGLGAGDGQEVRFRRRFKGLLGWFRLGFSAFTAADPNATIITVARLAWPVFLKQLFGGGKMLLVVHNWDARDEKPRLYYQVLAAFLKLARSRPGKVAVIVPATYWKNHLNSLFGVSPIVFPNLFSEAPYAFLRETSRKNPKLIHLGQYSEKIDTKRYLVLIHFLKRHGFVYYFSSNSPISNTDFPISFFETREAYLKQMSTCYASVFLNKINEGWNRVAHESLLVGTPIIVSSGGGIEELANTLGGLVMDDPAEIVAALNSPLLMANERELRRFYMSSAHDWVAPIVHFLNPEGHA
jgi:glycosyltransferase involved in cell wall biosynthesis